MQLKHMHIDPLPERAEPMCGVGSVSPVGENVFHELVSELGDEPVLRSTLARI